MHADANPSVAGAPAPVRRLAEGVRGNAMMSSRRRRRYRAAVARALGVPEGALDPNCRDELADRLVHAHTVMVWRLAKTLLVDGRDVEEVVNVSGVRVLRPPTDAAFPAMAAPADGVSAQVAYAEENR